MWIFILARAVNTSSYHVCLVCATSLQVWDCRFVYDMLCFLGVYWYVCLFICLYVSGYRSTDIKLNSFHGSGSSVGRVSACMCLCWNDLYVGRYWTTYIKLLHFCCWDLIVGWAKFQIGVKGPKSRAERFLFVAGNVLSRLKESEKSSRMILLRCCECSK